MRGMIWTAAFALAVLPTSVAIGQSSEECTPIRLTASATFKKSVDAAREIGSPIGSVSPAATRVSPAAETTARRPDPPAASAAPTKNVDAPTAGTPSPTVSIDPPVVPPDPGSPVAPSASARVPNRRVAEISRGVSMRNFEVTLSIDLPALVAATAPSSPGPLAGSTLGEGSSLDPTYSFNSTGASIAMVSATPLPQASVQPTQVPVAVPPPVPVVVPDVVVVGGEGKKAEVGGGIGGVAFGGGGGVK